MRQPHPHDDQIQHGDLHEDGQPDPSWLAGELELAQERPTTSLRGDPNHRKWMLIGVGGCGLITALAVLFLTREAPQAHAQPAEPAPAVEPAIEFAIEPTSEPSEPSEPSVSPKPVEKPTLAATTSVSATPTPAPPVAEPPAASPTVPTAAPSAAPPAAAPPAAPSASPVVPADEPPPAAPASELPDVEPWDDVDAAIERELSDAS